MKGRLVIVALCVTMFVSGFALCYQMRAFLPYPSNYVARLHWLEGWQSRGYYGFNCAAFISNAHGERYLTEREMWAGGRGKLDLVTEFADRYHVDESEIQPGDVAVFQGPTTFPFLGRGLHVAAYLGDGRWIDGDTRRGYVSEFRLADPSPTDRWFQGKVRIVRWKYDAKPRWHLQPVADQFFMSDFVNDYRLKDNFVPKPAPPSVFTPSGTDLHSD